MIDYEVNKLAGELAQAGIPVDVFRNYVEYRTEQVWMTIDMRPPYCDRGRWIVKVTPEGGEFLLSFDDQDGFPRYYFHNESLVREVRTWLETRKLI